MEPLQLLDDLTVEVGVAEPQNDELYRSDRHHGPLRLIPRPGPPEVSGDLAAGHPPPFTARPPFHLGPGRASSPRWGERPISPLQQTQLPGPGDRLAA